MLRGARSLRRRLERALGAPGASPLRALTTGLIALAALAVVAAAAAVPLWLRARFDERSAAQETHLVRAQDDATRAFVDAARGALDGASARLDAAARDPTASLEGAELWVRGARELPPAFACRDDVEAPRELADAAAAVVHAARAKDVPEIERAVRGWLALRAHHSVGPALELELSLAPLEAMTESGLVDAALLRALLVGGLVEGASRVAPLEEVALRGLPASCDGGVDARVSSLFLQNGVDESRLRARLDEWRALPQLSPPAAAGEWARGDGLFARVDREGRAVVVRTEEGSGAARAALARAGVASALRPLDGGRWIALEEATQRLPELELLGPARARFDATLRALTLAAATLAGGGLVLALVDRRRRRGHEALRRDLVAAVAHELKTPLASMRLQADALERWVDDERATRTLARLQEDVDALEGLVENVLSWGRLSRGGVVLREAEVSLLELCREALERAAREQPGLRKELRGDDVSVRADGELLRLVLGNLVRNAWRHNPRADKSVCVVLERADGRAVVRVTDNGVGVEEAERARIFRPFERSLTLARGSGLGLTLGREIARLHGGDVRLAETGPAGSTFVLELPA